MGNQWLEKELEGYAKTNINVLAQKLVMDSEGFELIGTQIPCVLGRIDMLCTWRMNLFIIEFKAVKATEKELGQTLRYSSLLQNVLDPYRHVSDKNFYAIANRVSYGIIPVIIAPDFDKTLFLSNCLLIKATKTETGGFSFGRASSPFKWSDLEHQNNQLVSSLEGFEKGIVGRAIGELIAAGVDRKQMD